jgi:hypothetical protein
MTRLGYSAAALVGVFVLAVPANAANMVEYALRSFHWFAL